MLENREDGEKEKATLIMADETKVHGVKKKNDLQVVIGLDKNNNKISLQS